MVVVPLSKPNGRAREPRGGEPCSLTWVAIAAGATLAASGALMVSGKRRAALVTAASGTALTMLDQQETVRTWWNALPVYLAEAQGLLARVQSAIDDISAQRDRLHKVLAK